jgi:hypothetical protein
LASVGSDCGELPGFRRFVGEPKGDRPRRRGRVLGSAPYCGGVRYLPFLISLALTVYALFSCIQTRTEDVPYLPKLVWLVLIVFVPFAGPIVWLLMSRNAGRSERPARRTPTPGRPVAPDDDPDFLATLERYRDPRMGGSAPPPQDPPTEEKPSKDKPSKDKSSKDKPSKDKADPKDSGKEAPTESDDGKQ